MSWLVNVRHDVLKGNPISCYNFSHFETEEANDALC